MAELKEKAAKTAKQAVEQAKDVDVVATTNQVTEIVADGAEAIADQFEHVAEVSRGLTPRQIGIVSVAVVAGVAVGGYIGYRIAEKRLSTKFEALIEEETLRLKQHYVEKAAREDKPDLSELVAERGVTPTVVVEDVAKLKEAVDGLEYNPESERLAFPVASAPTEPKAEVHVTNVFVERDEAEATAWDYAVELKKRDPRYPYVIHIDEFRKNETEYEQEDLTFYEADEVLADDKDSQVTDIDEAIGLDNLKKFGHGSADPNTVYIRNDVREVLYEVTLSNGKYAVEVHGFDESSLQHSDTRIRRVRFPDD